jgi:hypothetical protein
MDTAPLGYELPPGVILNTQYRKTGTCEKKRYL